MLSACAHVAAHKSVMALLKYFKHIEPSKEENSKCFTYTRLLFGMSNAKLNNEIFFSFNQIIKHDHNKLDDRKNFNFKKGNGDRK